MFLISLLILVILIFVNYLLDLSNMIYVYFQLFLYKHDMILFCW